MQFKENYLSFQREIEVRKIDSLIHFTPTINLYSIFELGNILSRRRLEQANVLETDVLDFAEFTDGVRYDDKNYINLSVCFPNYYLLSRFIQRTIDKPHIVWAVIRIDPKYLYLKDTLFSVTNAANSFNKRVYGISGDFRKFELMFRNNLQVASSGFTRTLMRNGLLSKYPTDVQAEVLVKDEISVSDILQICFKNNNDLASTRAAMSDFDTSKFTIDEKYFSNSRL